MSAKGFFKRRRISPPGGWEPPEIRIRILRRDAADSEPYEQCFRYIPAELQETVATALQRLNAAETLRDDKGEPAAPVSWECSCLQKKCGACAMVINGRPGLACDARLSDYKGEIRLEPLRKFPVVRDLIVDRTALYDNLREMKLWVPESGGTQDGNADTRAQDTGDCPQDTENRVQHTKDRARNTENRARNTEKRARNAGTSSGSTGAEWTEARAELGYEASRCLLCGCCLEVCPNFLPDGGFFGMAAGVPASRLLASLPAEQQAELAGLYRTHVYEGCGKSLACRNICPAGIDIDRMLVNSNAAAVWKRILK